MAFLWGTCLKKKFGSSVASAPLDSHSALRVPQGRFRSSCLALHTARYTAQASQFAQSGLGFQYLFDLNYIISRSLIIWLGPYNFKATVCF